MSSHSFSSSGRTDLQKYSNSPSWSTDSKNVNTIFVGPELKIFVEESSSDTAVIQRLPTKKLAKSSFFLINVAKSVGNPE